MTMRQQIDVDLEELDQIIDRSTHAPLSESEGQSGTAREWALSHPRSKK